MGRFGSGSPPDSPVSVRSSNRANRASLFVAIYANRYFFTVLTVRPQNLANQSTKGTSDLTVGFLCYTYNGHRNFVSRLYQPRPT